MVTVMYLNKPIVILNLLDTRFRDFSVSPTRTTEGQEVSITGTLDQNWPIVGWGVLPGANVNLEVDGKNLAVAATNGQGFFVFKYSATSIGTHIIRATYDGDFVVHNPTWSQSVKVEVISPEQQQSDQEMLKFMIVAGVIGAGVLGLGVALAVR